MKLVPKKEPRCRGYDVNIDAPTTALHDLLKTVDGMATRDDKLALEVVGLHAHGGEVTIVDSLGFPLVTLRMYGQPS